MSIATPLRAVALVHDRLVVGAAGLGTRAALDRAVDVVVGDRRLLGLLDGVVERRVAGEVAAARARRDLDVLDQLGEQLAALGVDRRPSCAWWSPTWSGRTCSPSSSVVGLYATSAVRDQVDEQPWTRASPPTSGWNDVASRGPDGPRRSYRRPARRSTRASTSTSGADRLDPRRADEDRVHRRRSSPATSRSSSKESTWRPNALRRTVMSSPPRSAGPRAVRDPVGQHDHPGAGAEGRQPAAHGVAQRRPICCASCSSGRTSARRTQLHGQPGLARIAQLQGFEAAAGAWERAILSARLTGYDSAWLDALCLSGGVTWGRLARARGRHAQPRGADRAGPPRRSWLLAPEADAPDDAALSAPARDVLGFIGRAGASFLDDSSPYRRLRAEVEDAMGGWCRPGGHRRRFLGPARADLGDADTRRRARRWHARWHSPRRAAAIGPGAGRCCAGRTRRARRAGGGGPAGTGDATRGARAPYVKRYGVVFRDLLGRETQAPPWRDLVRIYRRLEMSGELRGGRLVGGFVGEQFAAPDAVDALRATRRDERRGALRHGVGVRPAEPGGRHRDARPRVAASHTTTVPTEMASQARDEQQRTGSRDPLAGAQAAW